MITSPAFALVADLINRAKKSLFHRHQAAGKKIPTSTLLRTNSWSRGNTGNCRQKGRQSIIYS